MSPWRLSYLRLTRITCKRFLTFSFSCGFTVYDMFSCKRGRIKPKRIKIKYLAQYHVFYFFFINTILVLSRAVSYRENLLGALKAFDTFYSRSCFSNWIDEITREVSQKAVYLRYVNSKRPYRTRGTDFYFFSFIGTKQK